MMTSVLTGWKTNEKSPVHYSFRTRISCYMVFCDVHLATLPVSYGAFLMTVREKKALWGLLAICWGVFAFHDAANVWATLILWNVLIIIGVVFWIRKT